jgi:hypothetical protein
MPFPAPETRESPVPRILFAFAVAAGLLSAPHPVVAQDTIVGSWMLTLDSPEGTFNIPLTISREEARLVARLPTGAVFFTGVETPTGVEFHWDLTYQGAELPTTLVVSFRDGGWTGTADFGGAAAGTWVARAAPAGAMPAAGAAPPPAGTTPAGAAAPPGQ